MAPLREKNETASTINPQEIRHFAMDSARWWDENGPFKPLHRLNPVRLAYIKRQICAHFGRDFNDLNALAGLRVLDIGCGGGLVCEPLARLGATVTGVDADAGAIAAARTHGENAGLSIEYQNAEMPREVETFDVVLALEVIEHVNDPAQFIKNCRAAMAQGGLLILSTLNRTPKSFALGIVAAEYILRWVPRGTHTWQKFRKPSEIAALGRGLGLETLDVCGLIFHPLRNEFALSPKDLDVNYLITLR